MSNKANKNKKLTENEITMNKLREAYNSLKSALLIQAHNPDANTNMLLKVQAIRLQLRELIKNKE